MIMLTDNDIMPFGKHKGIKMANVPDSYLLWLYETDKCGPDVKGYITDNIEAIKANVRRLQK